MGVGGQHIAVLHRRQPQRVPGRRIDPRAGVADQGSTRLGVGLGQEPVRRHLHVVGIPVIGLAVGEGELDRLRQQVEVPRRVVAQRAQVVRLEEVQHLEQHGPLAPEAAHRHFELAESRPQRRCHLHAELGQVFRGEEAAFPPVEGADRLGDLPPVKRVARRPDGLLPALAPGAALGGNHSLDGPGQLGLDEALPGSARPAARKVEGGGGGPAAEGRLVVPDEGGGEH